MVKSEKLVDTDHTRTEKNKEEGQKRHGDEETTCILIKFDADGKIKKCWLPYSGQIQMEYR